MVHPGPSRRNEGLPAREPGRRNGYLVLALCGLLFLAVGLVFAQTVCYQFVNFDDGGYVYDNPQISGGFTARGIAWVFTHEHVANWHPVTGLSHQLDCQLFGLSAGAHHVTNCLLHAAAVVLLFLVLWRMTGGFWPSAMAAALFAVHPLRVESVAWISERKDVLSGLFFMLTLAAYVGYVRNPPSLGRYLLLAVFFALGLMAKPMLVTLPLVLLLLDYWPLGRVTASPGPQHCKGGGFPGGANFLETVLSRYPLPQRLVIEKIPLFVLVAVSCATTFWAQGSASALDLRITVASRITNALVAYATYLVQLFWPVGLAAFYPHPGESLPVCKFLASLIVLCCISLAALAYRRRYPYLLVGWLWFLGMLFPVSGVCQAGSQAMADRFTYLPHIGLYLALIWAVVDQCRSRPYRRWLYGIASALVLAILMGGAWRQTCFWCDSETLWTHSLACTGSNCVAHHNLGNALADRGEVDSAIAHYQEALEIKPDLAGAHNDLGNALAGRGQVDLAVAHYRQALKIKPDFAEAHNDLGKALAGRGEVDSAIAHYQKALEIKPDNELAYNNLGVALAGRGQVDAAMACFRKALEIKPSYAEAHYNLGIALAGRGQIDAAMACFRKALEIKPSYAEARYNLVRS